MTKRKNKKTYEEKLSPHKLLRALDIYGLTVAYVSKRALKLSREGLVSPETAVTLAIDECIGFLPDDNAFRKIVDGLFEKFGLVKSKKGEGCESRQK